MRTPHVVLLVRLVRLVLLVLLVRLVLLHAALAPQSALAASMHVIPLAPVTPGTLSSDEVWESLGVDAQGHVYIASSAVGPPTSQVNDVGLFRYTPSTDTLTFLTSAKAVIAAAGNLQDGEGVAKIHTDWVPYQGKLYMATSNFHGTEDPATIRGAHLLQFDPATGQFDDLARFVTGGVIAPNAGIQGFDIDQANGIFVGMTYPSGQLVRFNLGTHALTINAPPVSFQQVTRKVLATPGFGYFTYLESYTDERGPLRSISSTTGTYALTSYFTGFGIVHGRVHSPDGSAAWLLDELAGLTQLTVASGALANLGTVIIPADLPAGYNHAYALALSNDGAKLFSFLETTSSLYSYDTASGTRTNLGSFNSGAAWPNGVTGMTVDTAGNIYLADFDGGSRNATRLVQLSGVSGSPPKTTLSAGCSH